MPSWYNSQMTQLRRPGQFHPQDLDTLLASATPDITWLWEPFIPTEALVLLSAYMKVGKSTMMYGLISSILKGVDFLGYRTTKTNILILAVEESERDVRNRLLNFNVTEGLGLFVHVGRMIPSPENYSMLRRFCQDKQIGLIVVDTLSTYISVEDENNNSEVLRAVQPLLDIAHTDKISVVMVHHNNKGEGDGGKGIRGASSLFGLVDQALILRYQGSHKGRFRKLETLGRYDETPREVVFEMDTDYTYRAIGSEADALLNVIQLEVREVLLSLGEAQTLVQLGEQLPSRKLKAIQKALSPLPGWMKREGLGVKGDPYRYSLLEAPSASAEEGGHLHPLGTEWLHPDASHASPEPLALQSPSDEQG